MEACLRRYGVRFAYVAQGYHPRYRAIIENIGYRMGFQASLAIWIILDTDLALREIGFRVDYLETAQGST